MAMGQVGTKSVGLVGSLCQLTQFAVGKLLFNFLPVLSIYLNFKKLNKYVLATRVQIEATQALTHCYEM
jgi:hypothetical protein